MEEAGKKSQGRKTQTQAQIAERVIRRLTGGGFEEGDVVTPSDECIRRHGLRYKGVAQRRIYQQKRLGGLCSGGTEAKK